MTINFVECRGQQTTVLMSEFAKAPAKQKLSSLYRRYYRDEDIPVNNPNLASRLCFPSIQRLEVRIEILLSNLDEINEMYEYLAIVQLDDRQQPEGITFTTTGNSITFEAY